jgi:hypothetical protein
LGTLGFISNVLHFLPVLNKTQKKIILKIRFVLYFLFFVVWIKQGISQTWEDSVQTIYTSSSRLHHPAFIKKIHPYYFQDRPILSIVEDSGVVSLIKAAYLGANEFVFPSFHTIITRSTSIGKTQFIGIYDYPDSLLHQYLFWEEGLGSNQRIMYSHCRQDSVWETPRYFSPSLYRQQELISTQTNMSSYPEQLSFAVGWNEHDSLTIVNLTSDSILSKIRIATNSLIDSVRPAISDGMIAWETHNSTSMLRYAAFDVSGSIISSDTIPSSQNASYPVFLSSLWDFSP